MPDKTLSDAEVKHVTELLSKLEPGFLPFTIFHEVARLMTIATIEIVPLRRRGDVVEILLVARESDDPIWPGALHVPGSVIRATDTFESTVERVMTKELNNVAATKPTFVRNIIHHSGRGMESSQVYWIEVQGAPTVGTFYDVTKLPETLVQSQLDFLPTAIKAYQTLTAQGHIS